MTWLTGRRPDWSVAPPPYPAHDVGWIQTEDVRGAVPPWRGHECRSALALPMAPWLLARAVRRMWRRMAGWWR